jgi:hypothetical protein
MDDLPRDKFHVVCILAKVCRGPDVSDSRRNRVFNQVGESWSFWHLSASVVYDEDMHRPDKSRDIVPSMRTHGGE